MEGLRAEPPSSMIPFFWSPGWNSVQSVNKYQEEVGAALRGGDPGVRLIEPTKNAVPNYFVGVPDAFRPLEDHLWLVPLHHIFGSEELSSKSHSVSQRIGALYILLNAIDAAEYHLSDNLFSFSIENQTYKLPVHVTNDIPVGMAALPYGYKGVPYGDLPEWCIVKSTPKSAGSASGPVKVKTKV
jgi:NADH-quinone oxidoreductase subunit G